MQGSSDKVYDENEYIGLEVTGNSALYQGDYKIVRNRPPTGDNIWHLYNLANDPGETDDLVMASLLAVRMLQVLTSYHKELDTHLTDFSEETLEPMPFVAMF